ncbi:MAG: PAS domain S-box protein [Natronospirillum sp.]|uniref:sensor histidine kinase n=1 Tax=Natronospirillum sp. TaxID=2812955 RepID=UPI0025F4BD90|nr:PAS domain S-box protein [Natronospirillum sp.]MCH8553209.1 PAS domain S-box protein [Natronospirillum sp.]
MDNEFLDQGIDQEISRMELHAIMQAATDVIVTIDHHGMVLRVNSALETLFGYQAQELIGQSISLLMPAHHADKHDMYLSRYLQTGEQRLIGLGRELVAKHKNGNLFPVSLSVRPVTGFPRFIGIIRDMTQQLQLEREYLQCSEMERNRISRELHDDLGQNLAGMAMQVRSMASELQRDGNNLGQQLLMLSDELQQSVRSIKLVINELATVDLEEQGLEVALMRFVDRCNSYGTTPVRMHSSSERASGNYGVEVQLYRIAREAIHNALKHAEASLIEVRLEQTPMHVQLEVDDNGKGLPFKVNIGDGRLNNEGNGLRNIHFRAHVIGASLIIHSSPGAGTRLQCYYSLPRHEGASTGHSDEQGIGD